MEASDQRVVGEVGQRAFDILEGGGNGGWKESLVAVFGQRVAEFLQFGGRGAHEVDSEGSVNVDVDPPWH